MDSSKKNTPHSPQFGAVSVFDVAAYILSSQGEMTAMKLQKLVYYCQAWSLVWDEQPLFNESIRAWANGPVVRELFEAHKGEFMIVAEPKGNVARLHPTQIETIDEVLRYYGERSSQWLSDLTHMEDPWRDAREGLSDGERGDKEITRAALAEYYGSLPPK